MEPRPLTLGLAFALLLAAESPLLTLSLSPKPPIRSLPPLLQPFQPPLLSPPPSPPRSPPRPSSPPRSSPRPLSAPRSPPPPLSPPQSPPLQRSPSPPSSPPRSPPSPLSSSPPRLSSTPLSPPPPPSPSSPEPPRSPPHPHAPSLKPPMPSDQPNDDQGTSRRPPTLPPPVSCAIVWRSPCSRYPSPPGGSDQPSRGGSRSSSRRVSELNLGKKVGLAFAAVLIVLQVVFGGFLLYKRRQIGKVGYQPDLTSASPSALSSAS